MGQVFEIHTPKGVISKVRMPNGDFKMRVEWNPGFEDYMERKLDSVQKVIDSEVMRLNDPYVPKDTGILIQSGIMHTELGSGEVIYNTPYARRQYYIPMEHKEGKRCAYWFEQMKNSGGKEKILNAARKAVGGT